MTALCANRLADEGRLEVDAPVAKYWPEFARAGKEGIRVRWLLSHRAGLPTVRRDLPADAIYDWELMIATLEEEAPWWEPGTRHGYHALTFGFLVGEVLRRIDGRSLGTYFREEVAEPLELDFHIGLDRSHDARCAEMIPIPRGARSALYSSTREAGSMLEHYRRQAAGRRWRLVLAGDLVDFIGINLVPSDLKERAPFAATEDEQVWGLDPQPDRCAWMMSLVLRRHPGFFRSLAAFVADGHELVLIRGNHDAAFFWPEVQGVFRDGLVAAAAQNEEPHSGDSNGAGEKQDHMILRNAVHALV